jgi:hypothetical protein
MSQKSISSAGQPSFLYLMMARSCFQRARRAGHRTGPTLRAIGRDYLTRATKVTSASQSQQSRLA